MNINLLINKQTKLIAFNGIYSFLSYEIISEKPCIECTEVECTKCDELFEL